ncbi:unnamed protein product [Vicia faba]|uniref:Uncharacterized protein n=1 Tax=Vicia faba TaxID=3906 RepID=A0AAV1ACI0_VICFA|nr:unnamed protein product [Vicia faba]
MWSTIANLKENLNKIALVLHDDEEDEMLRMYGGKSTTNGVESRVSDRRNSNRFLRSKSGIRSPLTNGIDHVSISEIEQYKAEIKRLQASEAEIKALSVNYAALLKDKEGQNVRLNKENGSLKQDLEAANAALSASRNEGSRASTSGTSSVKLSKAVQYSSEIRKLKLELKQERDQLANIQLNFREEQESNNSFREELKMLKLEREKTSKELRKVQYELNVKASEIKHLRFELTRRKNEEAEEDFDSLKRLIKTLEKENNTLKIERNEIEAAFQKSRKSFTGKMLSDALHIQKTDSSSTSDIPDHSESFPGKEEMERDKALQELSRLKQHLLQKASEEAEKMDEDSKIIEELCDSNNYLRAQISHLERTRKQAIASPEELKMANNNEILKSREVIDDLNKKLTNCLSTIDSKNIELSNLQTALGQYYAEIKAKIYKHAAFSFFDHKFRVFGMLILLL